MPVPRRAELAVVAGVAALWFGIVAGVVVATTAPGEKPAAPWLAALGLSVAGVGVAGGALARAHALAVAAALAVGLDAGVAFAFIAGGACAVENGNGCGTAASWGALLLLVPAFCAFLLPVLLGRRLRR